MPRCWRQLRAQLTVCVRWLAVATQAAVAAMPAVAHGWGVVAYRLDALGWGVGCGTYQACEGGFRCEIGILRGAWASLGDYAACAKPVGASALRCIARRAVVPLCLP